MVGYLKGCQLTVSHCNLRNKGTSFEGLTTFCLLPGGVGGVLLGLTSHSTWGHAGSLLPGKGNPWKGGARKLLEVTYSVLSFRKEG